MLNADLFDIERRVPIVIKVADEIGVLSTQGRGADEQNAEQQSKLRTTKSSLHFDHILDSDSVREADIR